MKNTLKAFLRVVDIFLVPVVYPSALLMLLIRKAGVSNLPNVKKMLFGVGVFPIRDHYYEPQFNVTNARRPFSQARCLPGIEWSMSGQLQMLDSLIFSGELKGLAMEKKSDTDFYLKNTSFESGDAEFWYQIIRLKKPRRIYEIGSGNSTLMAIKAIERNKLEDPDYSCEHVCIEPYEMPWLEKTSVAVVRKKVEDVDPAFFSNLGNDDILFIDSSHVIRPEGDVLCEYLEILPSLKSGVIVHVHDIFSPRNYPGLWLVDEVRLWNEQYLLEAFLCHNSSWKIIGAINFLKHEHFDRLKLVAPYLTEDREPGSFYMQKL